MVSFSASSTDKHPPGQHHVRHHRIADDALNANGAAAADENAALAFGQAEERRAVGDPDMGRRRKLQAAADDRAVQRGDERDRAARDDVEHFVPGVIGFFARPRRLHSLQQFFEVEAGGKVHAVTEDHAGVGLLAGPHDGVAQLHDDGVVDGVALLRAVQPDERDRAVEFVGDQIRGHSRLPLQR